MFQIFMMLVSSIAFADQRLIEIKAEKYPDETFYMGVHVDAQYSINGIYYEDQNNSRTEVPFEQVAKGYPIFTTPTKNPISGKTKKYNVVSIQFDREPGSKGGTFYFTYLYNGLTERYVYSSVQIVFDAQKLQYQVLNMNGLPISHAMIATRFWNVFGKKFEVGIKSIHFQ